MICSMPLRVYKTLLLDNVYQLVVLPHSFPGISVMAIFLRWSLYIYTHLYFLWVSKPTYAYLPGELTCSYNIWVQ